ncbi:FAD/NAD(P)-binding protein [Streptomyces galilaeus]|uniref:FAD/NAD(P)-binding protein n=1 Tax=Streptomyces galilaeus TaxID=33899 RepID=UPI0038F65898
MGAGPRGLAVLERLCANHTDARQLSVHVVDPYPPGPGRTWRTRQSPHLLMNTVTSQVSQFTDSSLNCAGPIRPGPNLCDWLGAVGTSDENGWSAAERLGPDDYPSRAQFGRYLEWVFQHIVATAPDSVRIVVHQATAVALDEDASGQYVTLDDGTRLAGLDAVVLSLGHGPNEPTAEEQRLATFAIHHNLRYVPPNNPAEVDFDGIAPGEPVGLRGLGLAFFDVLSLLTEGRGGKFVPSDQGLRYLPSGQEPLLFAGSRRGVPYHARGENHKGPAGRHQPLFLTTDSVRRIRDTPGASFRRHVWPLLDAEIRAAYYHAIVAERKDLPTALRFLSDYRAASDSRQLAILRTNGISPQDEWDWERVERPWARHSFADRARYNDWLISYLREDVRHAKRGNVHDPLKAALDVLRDLRNEVRLAIDHAGITGSSYRDEVVGWFTPLNAYLSIGPPPSRVEEMTALIEGAVLQVVGPETWARPDPESGRFLVGSSTIAGSEIRTTTLIDARIPDTDLRRSKNPMLRHLLATAQCRPYQLPDPRGSFETGGLDITGRPYRVVDAAGVPHPRRFAFGVPTEFVHWATAAGIRPGVGSVILEDADAIARAALRL